MATKYINASALAERWGYSRYGIVKRIMAGNIPAFQITPNSEYRISLDWIEKHERSATEPRDDNSGLFDDLRADIERDNQVSEMSNDFNDSAGA